MKPGNDRKFWAASWFVIGFCSAVVIGCWTLIYLVAYGLVH